MSRYLEEKHFFISCATNEFGGYRVKAATRLEGLRFRCDYQENFNEYHFDTITKLAVKILRCQCFVHVFGNGIGTRANRKSVEDFMRHLPKLDRILDKAGKELIRKCAQLEYSYTSWELILAKAFGKPIAIFYPSNEIADGHPEGRDRFDVSREDSELVERHRSFLEENHLKESRFFACVQSLVDGCVQAKNILEEDPFIPNDVQSVEFYIQEELLELIENDRTLSSNAPARIAKLLAILNGKIGWKIPSAFVRNGLNDCSRDHVRVLIEWAVGHEDSTLLLKFICVLDQLCNYENIELSKLKRKLFELRNTDAQKIETEISRDGVLEKLDDDARLLFSTSLPKGQSYCFLKWAGVTRRVPISVSSFLDLERVFGKGKHLEWLKQGKIDAEQTPELSFIKPVRIEIFIDDGEFADRDWFGVEAGVTLGIPVTLRRRRDQDDFGRLGGNPPAVLPEDIPCISGTLSIPISDQDKNRIANSGFFLGALSNPIESRPNLFWQLSNHSLAGIWVRQPVPDSDLQALIKEIGKKKLDEIPGLLSQLAEKTPSVHRHCIVFVDRNDGQFPPPRPPRLDRFHKNTYR